MKHVRLSKEEKEVEKSLIHGEYLDVEKMEFDEIAQVIANRKKDAVLNIRVNHKDLEGLKSKAKRYGIRYQTFLSELIHRIAQDDVG